MSVGQTANEGLITLASSDQNVCQILTVPNSRDRLIEKLTQFEMTTVIPRSAELDPREKGNDRKAHLYRFPQMEFQLRARSGEVPSFRMTCLSADGTDLKVEDLTKWLKTWRMKIERRESRRLA